MKKKIAITIAAILVIALLFEAYRLKKNNTNVSNDVYDTMQEAVNDEGEELDKMIE